VPIIEAARRLGLRSIVLDANPAAPGLALADLGVVADIKDAARALEIARRERASGVTSACTDYAVRTVAAVAAGMHLPGLTEDAARMATDKMLMREAFERAGAPSPRALRVSSETGLAAAARELAGRFIVKPTDGVGSKGVTRAAAVADLARALAARDGGQPQRHPGMRRVRRRRRGERRGPRLGRTLPLRRRHGQDHQRRAVLRRDGPHATFPAPWPRAEAILDAARRASRRSGSTPRPSTRSSGSARVAPGSWRSARGWGAIASPRISCPVHRRRPLRGP